MTQKITTKELSDKISELSSKYLDCRTCPKERNCCIAEGNYTVSFDRKEMKVIFGIEVIKEKDILPKNLTLNDGANVYYVMRDMPCPRYDQNIGCMLHDKKKELGLEICMRFPIYAMDKSFMSKVDRYLFGEIFDNILYVNINYFCNSVERRWKEWSLDLLDIYDKFSVPVLVIYADNDGCSNSLNIKKFNVEFEKGLIPSQKDYKKKQ